MYIINSKSNCIYCHRARALLLAEGLEHEVVKHDTPESQADFKAQGFRTFPQIYRSGAHIGGYEELLKHLNVTPKTASAANT